MDLVNSWAKASFFRIFIPKLKHGVSKLKLFKTRLKFGRHLIHFCKTIWTDMGQIGTNSKKIYKT